MCDLGCEIKVIATPRWSSGCQLRFEPLYRRTLVFFNLNPNGYDFDKIDHVRPLSIWTLNALLIYPSFLTFVERIRITQFTVDKLSPSRDPSVTTQVYLRDSREQYNF